MGLDRVTRDIDLNVLAGFGGEDRSIDCFLSSYAARLPDARDFACRNRVLLISTPNGTGIDVSLGALPFEAFASRPLDIRDAEGVAIRNRKRLDWSYIEQQLQPLAELKGQPEITGPWLACMTFNYALRPKN